MLLLLLNYVVLGALWKIDVHLISTLVNKSLYYYYYYLTIAKMIIRAWIKKLHLHHSPDNIYKTCMHRFGAYLQLAD